MDDLISRQAAISRAVTIPMFGRDIRVVGVSELESLPSAQPEQRWIPLKEREPKEEGEYLVSFDDGFIATTGYYDNDFELWADACEPLAWMPLPEAYREEK